MRPRLGGLGLGLVFGVVLAWSGMTSPQVVREALLFERSYLFLFFASAVLVASVGLALLRRLRARALLVDAPIGWRPERPGGRHIIGSLLFGIGWGICDSCPGPIATQVGQGIAWSLFTLAGVLLGVYAFLRREQPETEPATDRLPARVAGLSFGSAVGAQP